MSTPVSELLAHKGCAVFTIHASAAVFEAVREMNRRKIGALLVVNPNGTLAGIFSERDILTRVIDSGRNPMETPLGEVMTRNLVTIAPETSIDQAMDLMTHRRCRHLPVVTDGRLRGLISIGDIMRWLVHQHQSEAEALRSYINGFA